MKAGSYSDEGPCVLYTHLESVLHLRYMAMVVGVPIKTKNLDLSYAYDRVRIEQTKYVVTKWRYKHAYVPCLEFSKNCVAAVVAATETIDGL